MIKNPSGSLTIIAGDKPLYVVAIVPSMPSASVGGGQFSGRSGITDFERRFVASQKTVTLKFTWDRRTDRLTIGDRTFDREKGNVFVLVGDEAGRITATQHGPLDLGGDPLVVMPKIRALLPDDSPAKAAKLVFEPE